MDETIGRPTRFLVRTLLFLAAVGGVVYLMGIAQSQAELDRVTGHARNQSYVRRVVSHVRIKDQSAPAAPVGGGSASPSLAEPSAPVPSNRRDAVTVAPL